METEKERTREVSQARALVQQSPIANPYYEGRPTSQRLDVPQGGSINSYQHTWSQSTFMFSVLGELENERGAAAEEVAHLQEIHRG